MSIITNPVDAARRCFEDRLDASLLARAVGSFAAVVLDTSDRVLSIVTDPYGTCPVYIAEVDGLVLFAGRQSAILATGLVRPTVDPEAVSSILQIGYVGGDRTLLESVRLLPPGSICRIDTSGRSVATYHRLRFEPDNGLRWDEAVGTLSVCMKRAVHRTTDHRKTTAVPISGGLDSRLLLGSMNDPSAAPSFTFGAAGCRDLVYGKRVAQAVGSPHRFAESDPCYLKDHLHLGVWLTEGLLGANHFHILPAVPSLAKMAPVALDGIGGDVILGGKYVRQPWLDASDAHVAGAGIWSWLAGSGDARARLDPAFAARMDAVNAQTRDQLVGRYLEQPGTTPMDKAMAFLLEDRTRRFIGCGRELLRWQLETHHPFFDQDLLRAVARVPYAWRLRQRLILAVVRRAAPAASRSPWQRTGLPASVPFRFSWLSMAFHRGADMVTKRLGLPSLFRNAETSRFGLWFRGPLLPFVEDVLLSEASLDRGLVSADFLRAVVSEHKRGLANWSNLIGTLLSVEQFCRCMVDDLRPPARLPAWNAEMTV